METTAEYVLIPANEWINLHFCRIDAFMQFSFIYIASGTVKQKPRLEPKRKSARKTLFHQEAALSRSGFISPADGWLVRGGGGEGVGQKEKNRQSIHATALVILQNWDWADRGQVSTSVCNYEEGRERESERKERINTIKPIKLPLRTQ